MGEVMSWEESMAGVFDDLEQQAQGLHLLERDAEVAELTAAEYAEVPLAGRLHASLGHDLRVQLRGGEVVSGRLARVGAGWFLLVDSAVEWVVCRSGVGFVAGLSPRVRGEAVWSAVDRLSVRTVLRRLAEQPGGCTLHLVDGRRADGRVGRVGADFFELRVGEGSGERVLAVETSAVAALQGRVG